MKKVKDMKLSQKGSKLIKDFEGFREKTYKCSAGVLTIGYGHTKDVKMNQKINRQQADELFRKDIEPFEKEVNKINQKKNYNLNQNQFDSLVSFTYNLGQGRLNTLTKNRTKDQLPSGMKLYNKVGKKVIPGLVNRRNREVDLFNQPIGNNTPNLSSNFNKPSIHTNIRGPTISSNISRPNFQTNISRPIINSNIRPTSFIQKTNNYTSDLNRMNNTANNFYRPNPAPRPANISGPRFIPKRGGPGENNNCIIF